MLLFVIIIPVFLALPHGSYYTPTLAHIEEVKTTAFFGAQVVRRPPSGGGGGSLSHWGKEGGREGGSGGAAVTQGENDFEIAPFLEKGRRRRFFPLPRSATRTGYGGLID